MKKVESKAFWRGLSDRNVRFIVITDIMYFLMKLRVRRIPCYISLVAFLGLGL